ncbi:rod shape-determining protein MreD [Cyanobium sp. HWJ4-Hawea]|uniref:rod shape-determining protein MreD n=1 Tax=Cyanobium sp. HWJ4-Hawea TaxID=2823713 RepID=UPI0020CD3B76|nr:rod shape-determining protein MreD [Cyanobium sp. HWJ4-Hawea]MCP9808610.1 rod shape-determining protein MreD [Cyanobium sp. HWJ4-Hawea]
MTGWGRIAQGPGWWLATALVVPFLSLASPWLLKLGGVAPAWSVLWLLPWALVGGPLAGAMAGLGLALLLDGLHLGFSSQVPALLLLGWWWGRLGSKGLPIERSFSLGLLALLGSLLLGFSVLVQELVAFRWAGQPPGQLFSQAFHQTTYTWFAQTLLTALLAPPLCSLQLLFWRRKSLGGRRSPLPKQ